jgi:hypothetical protein
MRARRAILVFGEEAAERGTHAQHVEVVAADHVRVNSRALPSGGDRERHPAPGGHRIQRVHVIAQVGVVVVRPLLRDRAVGARGAKADQPVLADHPWQRAKQQCIHPAENRRDCAAAKRDDEHHHPREDGALAKHPPGEAHVGQERADQAFPPVIAHLLPDDRCVPDLASRSASRLVG